jgi:hypothetical protein
VSEGLSFTINRATKQCEEIRINGKRLDTSRTYKIATNSYLAMGGDGYKVFLKALSKYDCSIFQRDVLAEYIEHLGGTVKPQVSGRINFIGKETQIRPFQLAALRLRSGLAAGRLQLAAGSIQSTNNSCILPYALCPMPAY